MTKIPPSPSADDPVERAAASLRQTSIPGGPSDETIARVLSAIRAASAAEAIPLPKRGRRRLAWKIAVVGVLAAGVIVSIAGLLSPHPPLAFADVAARLRDAHTLTYEVTYQIPEKKEPEKIKIFYKEPGRLYAEGGGTISISDLREGKTLILDPAARTAMLIDFKVADAKKEAQKSAASLIDELRKLADKKGESVGKRRIGDLETEGFRVESDGFPLTLWANPKTKMPVLIEMRIRVGEQENVITMSNFQLDPKLDDALFLMEPPEGYTLRKMEMEEGKLEDDVVHLLRAYAGKYNGTFPKSLSVISPDWQTYFKERWGEKPAKGLPEAEAVQFVQKAMHVEQFLRSKKDHGYKPEGARLGDRAKIIFWYRLEKSDTYRAVYGDLHVADVTTDQLPGT